MNTAPTTEPGIRSPRLLPIPEVAKRLAAGEQTIRDWLHRGDLPLETVKIGRKRYVREADLDRFIAGGTS